MIKLVLHIFVYFYFVLLKSATSVCNHQASEIVSFKAKIASLETTISGLEEKSREEELKRRELHNTIQELKGNIRVYCRVRPMLPSGKFALFSHCLFACLFIIYFIACITNAKLQHNVIVKNLFGKKRRLAKQKMKWCITSQVKTRMHKRLRLFQVQS
jgi:hypothetical protein